MNDLVFNDCLEHWLRSNGYTKFWGELAEKYGFETGEGLRLKFKKERRKRGINKENAGVVNKPNNQEVSIIVFDIELSPLRCFAFDIWEQNIGVDQIISESFMLSWSAKFLNKADLFFGVVTPDEAIKGNDYRITKSIWDLLNSAQILIGHNIRDFDLKKLNVRFLAHGLPPLSKSQIVDTLLVARQNFSFPSNSLKFLNKALGIKQKQETEGFNLWRKCMEGDKQALDDMNSYCQGDVLATEDLYFKIRPFVRAHPNLALYFDTNEERCPNCGSTTMRNGGYYYTPAGKYASMRCECGAVSRSKQNELEKEKRKSLMVN